ncbi:hypothetical protein PM033_14415 [Halorubrum ezzemoulense]|jgi:hypothetical protein|uniref:hypothetical protein n=1 Tax=Halorubrum ezzemoulense TaxID=337243 RepID=UPI00232B4553|nr:hypothetical protein [Halorubrum ezzemoulense]MDB2252953.1 hypothetical protein [Halorubrum ezzemoulense]MDB9256334.1 hypothetical protein [Halorubrum ezzemoulense]MDB9277618.1 hypothetical protein [Halorubrum ezzemoulense]
MSEQTLSIVAMCHHYDEAMTWEEVRARHRSEEADEEPDAIPDADAVDEPAGETEEPEPPAEPRAPADD